jgi:hypothetical protein
MFVVLLTIGIGNILMSLASMVDRRSLVVASRLHLSWIVLLLLVYFSLFWHTLDVLSVEEWVFPEFLYIILGPVLVLFASQVLLPGGVADDTRNLDERYFEVSRPFFLLLAASQVWINGTDLLLQGGFTSAGVVNGIAALLALVLAFSRSLRVHEALAAVMWLMFLTTWVARSVG